METKRGIIGMTVLACLVAVLWGPSALSAQAATTDNKIDPINYAVVKEFGPEEIIIHYKSPGKDRYFRCDYDGDCDQTTASKTLLPTKYRDLPNPIVSSAGNKLLVSEFKDITSGWKHQIIDLANRNKSLTLDWRELLTAPKFSRDGQMLMARRGNERLIFDLTKNNPAPTKLTLPPSGLTLELLSSDGQVLSGYADVAKQHVLIETATGRQLRLFNELAYYAEVSDEGRQVAFLSEVDGQRALYVQTINNDFTATAPLQKVSGTGWVRDFMFLGQDLFFTANTLDDPYRYNLYKYDSAVGEAKVAAREATDWLYLKPLQGRYLLFAQGDGPNTHVALYDNQKGKVIVLNPLKEQLVAPKIKRSTVKLVTGAPGVLLQSSAPGEVGIIWLHGGPWRQTSLGYHHYASYAVFDDILDKLAEGGASILKLDYRGSIGHSVAWRDGLKNNIGVNDVADVTAGIAYLKEQGAKRVYLFGTSYGGYLGLRTLVEHPNLVTGVIATNPVVSWLTQTWKDQQSIFNAHFGGSAQDPGTWPLYTQAEILSRLGQITNQPVRLVVSRKDTEVPNWQSDNLFARLKTQGAEVRLIEFPESGHVFTERSEVTAICSTVADLVGLSTNLCNAPKQ
jgi:dipeptidyl aminopeptidase/acylaminoacyl peptidase